MKISVFISQSILVVLLFSSGGAAQQIPIDSLKRLLLKPMADTSKVLLLDQLGRGIMYSKPLEAMQYAEEGLNLAQKNGFLKGKSRILNRMGAIFRIIGNYPKALEMHIASLKIAEGNNDLDGMAKTFNNMGILYLEQKETQKSNEYFRKTRAIAEKINDQNLVQISFINIGSNYARLNLLDSARIYTEKAYQMARKLKSDNVNVLLMNLGNLYYRMDNYALSLNYYKQSLPFSKSIQDNRILSQTYYEMARVLKKTNSLDSSLYYAQKSLTIAQEAKNAQYIFEASSLLATLYDNKNINKAYTYFKQATAAKDSMFNQEKVKEVQKLGFNEQIRERELESTKKEHESRQKIGILLGILVVILLLTGVLYRNNIQKQKANALLKHQKEEINHQRDKAENALIELKNTQAQLIQAEKLASLGELTAGIAHEIQNPLNFVNNFSEVSIELISELLEEKNKEKSERDEELENDILNDLVQNQEKINQHGKRASSIVKNMLEHSRTNKGEKTLTDINKLTEEYLRLSYHACLSGRQGMKAKTNSAVFNADYTFVPDENLPLLNVIPQDVGRVLLNVINNAFQSPTSEGGVKKVIVKTLRMEEQEIWISVSDNGLGIPPAILSKIFQPFFTTKPPGEGTGLGLSLSYDIITKGHGGTIEVESLPTGQAGIEGHGTTFTIKLPIDRPV